MNYEIMLEKYGAECYTDCIFNALTELYYIANYSGPDGREQILNRMRKILNKVDYDAVIDMPTSKGTMASTALKSIKEKLDDKAFFDSICDMGAESQFLANDLYATLNHRYNYIGDTKSVPSEAKHGLNYQ